MVPCAFRAEATNPPSALQLASSFSVVESALGKATGQLTPEVRAAYLSWSEQNVLKQLLAAKESVPADCMAEVDADPGLRDAMFGSVDPPDPSILQNYASLREKLGPEFLRKYRALVVGAAVATRKKRVNVHETYAPESASEIEAEEADADYAAKTGEGDAGSGPPPKGSRLTHAIAEYMKSSKVSARDLYTDTGKKRALIASLEEESFPPHEIAQMQKTKAYVAALKAAMIELGQRPAHREAPPGLVAWLRYVVSVYEQPPPAGHGKHAKKTWPLFPMARAPWPLLMPMARTMPLGEARYIWEKYLGEHGPDRYHTYGPYREPQTEIPYELQPSPWHWNAWPDRIVHGGECCVMAGITMDTESALCEPTVRASQPRHCNLIAFKTRSGEWYTVIEQAFAGGPLVTEGHWLFRDSDPAGLRLSMGGTANNSGAEYQLGLSLGMDLGLRSYLDTRIAVGIFRELPAATKRTVGVNLLRNVLTTNPFNPEVWYLLARQTSSAMEGLALAHAVSTRNPATLSAGPEPTQKPLFEKWKESKHPQPIEKNIHEYWQTVAPSVMRFAVLRHPVPADEGEASAIYAALETLPGLKAEDKKPYWNKLGIPPEPKRKSPKQ